MSKSRREEKKGPYQSEAQYSVRFRRQTKARIEHRIPLSLTEPSFLKLHQRAQVNTNLSYKSFWYWISFALFDV